MHTQLHRLTNFLHSLCRHILRRRTARLFVGALTGLMLCVVASASYATQDSDPKPEVREQGLPDNAYALDRMLSCGPRCVSFVMNLFNKQISYSEILKECPPGPLGTSMQELKASLENHGLYVLGVKGVTVDTLKELTTPAIVHLTPRTETGHFVVVMDWSESEKTFHTYSPPRNYGPTSEEDLAAVLSGFALIVSDKPLPSIHEIAPSRISSVGLIASLCLTGLCLVTGFRELRRIGSKAGGKHDAGRDNAMVTTTTLVALLFLPLAGCSDQEVALTDGATETTEFEGPLNDVGSIIAGPAFEHTFRVKNESHSSFRITNIRKSCSCQDTTYDKDLAVEPGEYAVVTVKVPTKGREGRMEYNFGLDTDSTDERWASIPLKLAMELDPRIRAVPSQILFGNIDAGQGATATITVTALAYDVAKRFKGAALKQDGTSVQLKQVKDNIPQGTLQFSIDVAADAAIGDLGAKVVMEFDDEHVPQLEVPVFGRVQGNVQPTPRLVVINSSSGGESLVRLSTKDGTRFSVPSVAAADASITVAGMSDVQQSDHRYTISVADDAKPGFYHVKFSTNLEHQPTISVPVVVRR